MKSFFLCLLAFVSTIAQAEASKKIPQILVFVEQDNIEPQQVNDYLSANNIKKFDKLYGFGMEVTHPIIPRFNLGARVSLHYAGNGEVNKTSSVSTYLAAMQQIRGSVVARVDLVQNKLMRVGIVGGAGMTAARLSLNLASGNSQIDDGYNKDSMSNFYSFYGGTVALGWNQFFVVTEAGFENNKVGSLKYSSTATHTINSIDLSGAYFTVGLMWGSPGAKAFSSK